MIIRGIEKLKIVDDDEDRNNFVRRIGVVGLDTGTSIVAWALIYNHAHILLKSGVPGLSAFMRRVLGGYAASYNRRHKRHGHLFQNRYKSIICDEDPYFRELVRYIHLNPLRAGVVDKLVKLDRYEWSGHSVVMNYRKNDWQDREYVLKWFGDKEGEARRLYRAFVEKRIAMGDRPDLTGGGLIRSMGGWSVVRAMRRAGEREKGDERILGSGAFVSEIINQAEEKIKHQVGTSTDVDNLMKKKIARCCKREGVTVPLLQSGSRRSPLPKLRKILAKNSSMDTVCRWLKPQDNWACRPPEFRRCCAGVVCMFCQQRLLSPLKFLQVCSEKGPEHSVLDSIILSRGQVNGVNTVFSNRKRCMQWTENFQYLFRRLWATPFGFLVFQGETSDWRRTNRSWSPQRTWKERGEGRGGSAIPGIEEEPGFSTAR